MYWTSEHEVMLLREILLVDLFCKKEGSRERGMCLEQIAANLNKCETLWFEVDQRALRDKLKKLLQLFVWKKNQEEKGSGLEIEPLTETDELLQDIYDRKNKAELIHTSESAAKTKKIDEEKKQVEDVRKISTERLSEARKRKQQEGDSAEEVPKRRSSGGDTIAYLREKSEKDFEMREEELQLRKEELKVTKAREEALISQSNAMMNILAKLADKLS